MAKVLAMQAPLKAVRYQVRETFCRSKIDALPCMASLGHIGERAARARLTTLLRLLAALDVPSTQLLEGTLESDSKAR